MPPTSASVIPDFSTSQADTSCGGAFSSSTNIGCGATSEMSDSAWRQSNSRPTGAVGGVGGRLGMRGTAHRAGHQLAGRGAPGVALEGGGAVADGVVLAAVGQQQLGEVQP